MRVYTIFDLLFSSYTSICKYMKYIRACTTIYWYILVYIRICSFLSTVSGFQVNWQSETIILLLFFLLWHYFHSFLYYFQLCHGLDCTCTNCGVEFASRHTLYFHRQCVKSFWRYVLQVSVSRRWHDHHDSTSQHVDRNDEVAESSTNAMSGHWASASGQV